MTGTLLDLLADVLAGARRKGATEADAYVGEDQSFSAQPPPPPPPISPANPWTVWWTRR